MADRAADAGGDVYIPLSVALVGAVAGRLHATVLEEPLVPDWSPDKLRTEVDRQPMLHRANKIGDLAVATGLGHVPVIVGGIIPDEDADRLRGMGVARVYTPKDFELNTIMMDIVTLADPQAVAAQ